MYRAPTNGQLVFWLENYISLKNLAYDECWLMNILSLYKLIIKTGILKLQMNLFWNLTSNAKDASYFTLVIHFLATIR